MVKDAGRKYSVIAALFYILYAIASLSTLLSSGTVTVSADTMISVVISLVSSAAFAIVLLLGKRNIFFAVITIFTFLLRLGLDPLSTSNLSAAALVFLAMVRCVPALAGKRALVKKLWFAPALLHLLLGLGSNISTLIALPSADISYVFVLIFSSVVGMLPLLFVGMWLKHEPVKVPQKVAAKDKLAVEMGGADQLKMYKELLDAGAITQAEFEAHKKQILGL